MISIPSKTRNSWKNQYKHVESASKFHNQVRDIFASDNYFKGMSCYQEVNVADLVPSYPHRNHHFDWYIDELQTIVELHGEQHYKPMNYGNMGYEEARRAFRRMQDRDNSKKTAAIDAGYEYVAIPYKESRKLNAARLKHLIFYGTDDG